MLRFIVKRSAFMLLMVAGLLAITFTISHVAPGDPARLAAGPNATEAMVQTLRAEYGMDKPVVAQFGGYLAGVVQGDLGRSITTTRPVFQDLLRYFPATLELVCFAILLSIVGGVALGTLAAATQNRWPDHLIRLLSTSGVAFPMFSLGLLLKYAFAQHLEWLPLGGRLDMLAFPPDTITGFYTIDSLLHGDVDTFLSALSYMLLPALALSFPALASIIRVNRAEMLEVLRQDYIVAARARGALARDRQVRAAQRHAAHAGHDRPALRLDAGRHGADRIGVRLARHRPVRGAGHHEFRLPAHHGRDAGAGRELHAHQLRHRHHLRPAGPARPAAGLSTMSTTALPTSPDARHGLGRQLRLYASTFARNKSAMLGLVIVVGFLLVALFAPWLAPYPEDAAGSIKLAQKLLPPSSAHWFGTDEMGNDVFSRVILGARTSLQIGLTITVIAALIGVPLGVIAGYFGGRVQECIMRVTDIFLSVPGLVLAIAIVGALGPGILNAMIALSLVWWPGYVRLVQAKTLSLKGEVYIDAARMMGAGPLRIVFVHILPNCVSPIVIKASMDMGMAILSAASLGFLGLGAQPPAPEWGAMISVGRNYLPQWWWYSAFPGLAIYLTVLGFNLIGDGLRDVLDPKQRG